MWRRGSVTVVSLTGERWDRRKMRDYSWWVTEVDALAVCSREDYARLWVCLLSPPRRFFLSLLDGPREQNHLQLALANDYVEGIKADSPLRYTINGVPHTYTVSDLKDLIAGKEVTTPGLAALIRKLGRPPMQPTPEDKERGRPSGTPPNGKITKETVVGASGAVTATVPMTSGNGSRTSTVPPGRSPAPAPADRPQAGHRPTKR